MNKGDDVKAGHDMPTFTYHPDPVGTGAFEHLGRTCRCCELNRGWIYVLGAYGPEDLRDEVCPWCIADGSAAERFGVHFTGIGTAVDDVAEEVLDELKHRTPGFSGWQAERWVFHCNDAAAFLGAAGWETLEEHPGALANVREQVSGWGFEPDEVDAVVASLDVDGSATAYLFRCRHCEIYLAYADIE